MCDRIIELSGGAEVYLVGGTVRDLCLGRPTADLDLAVAGDAEAFARRLAGGLGGTLVVLDAARGAYRVVWHHHGSRRQVDVTPLPEGLEADLRRRDFTVNAMALPVQAWRGAGDWRSHVVDPLGGRRDLDERVLRATGPRVFHDDPVRIMRAARLVAGLNLRPEPATHRLMREAVGGLDRTAGERIWAELALTLACGEASAGLTLLDEVGALDRLFPFVGTLRRVEQDRYHVEPVWQHCRRTLSCLEAALRHLADRTLLAPWAAEMLARLERPLAAERPRRALLKLAALLHDAGKAAGGVRRPDGHISFRGHEEAGLGYADHAARRLVLARREHAYLRRLVYAHMYPLFLYLHRPVAEITLYRFFRRLGEDAPDLLLLSLADVGATHLAAGRWQELVGYQSFILEMLAGYFLGERRRPLRLVTGYDLQEHLGLPPSPVLGRLLERIEEAQVLGQVSTREQALALARKEVESGRCG